MTEKHWFIFRGDHHLGPFSFEEILDKVKLAEIDDDVLTWCEGNQDWLPVLEQPAIKKALRTEESQQVAQEIAQKQKQIELEAQLQEQLIAKQAEMEEARLEAIRLEEESLIEEVPPTVPIDSLSSDLEVPPPLPPLPIVEDFEEEEEGAPEGITAALIESSEQGEDFQVFTFVEKDINGSDDEYSDSVEKTGEITPKVDDEPLSGYRLYGAMALSLVGLCFFVYLILQTVTEKRKLYNVAGRDKDALYSVMTRPFKGVPIHRMRPAKDLNSLWLATNFPDEAVLYMTLKSIPGRFIGTGLVEVQGQARLIGGAALFDELEVLKGETLHIGEYEYEIKGKRVGLKGKLSEAFGQKAILKEVKFLRNEDQEFVLKGKLLLSPYAEEKFESKLKDHQEYVQKTIVKPLKDRLERYKTFMGLLERMSSLYQSTMGRITKGKSIYLFENRYNEEVGPFLRDLIIDCNRIHLSLFNLDPNESKAYEEVMNYGKDIGVVASDMVTKTRKYRTLGKKRTQWLIDSFNTESEKLRELGRRARQNIENELSPFEK